jgi:hypothetical protein
MTCTECSWECNALYIADNGEGECVNCFLKKQKDDLKSKVTKCCNSKVLWSFEKTIYYCEKCECEVNEDGSNKNN